MKEYSVYVILWDFSGKMKRLNNTYFRGLASAREYVKSRYGVKLTYCRNVGAWVNWSERMDITVKEA